MTYRDDREALEAQKTELEQKLRDLRAKLAESKAVEATTLATVRELEATYAKLQAAKQRAGERPTPRALPLLERVFIASPCAVPWESMTGDERERLCASCDKKVYDVSKMTSAEAEALLRAKSTDACLRIFRRFDGTVLTADCPVGVEKKKRARRRNVVVGALAATAAAATAAAATAAVAMRQLEQRSSECACEHGTRASVHPSVSAQPPRTQGGSHVDLADPSQPTPPEGVQLPPGVPMALPDPQERGPSADEHVQATQGAGGTPRGHRRRSR
jgi:hypothetical protein